MTEPVFLVGLAMVATSAVLVVKTIATAITGRNAQSDLNYLRDQMDQQRAALEDAQAQLTSQATQVAELHERVDFAERLLAQQRDRPGLGPGEKR